MSQVNDWSDGYASDYLRNLNAYGPASANVPRSSVVSHQVRYQSPVVLTEARTNDTPMYTEDDARGAYVAPASGYRAPAGGGWDVNSSDANLRFPNESGGRRYARSKKQSRASKPANGVKTRSAPLSGSDVTADVLRSVKADGNTSFANWRQSLVNQGWSQAEAAAVRYDPSTGKFMSNASGQAVTDHYMREQADKDAGIMADNPEVEGKVSGQTPAGQTPAGQTPAKTEGGAQPAPAKTEESTQPAPAKTEESTQPAPAKTDTQTPAPADDHEQEAKAAVDEFLKQHPADGKERLKSIYAAVDSQNIKDDAAYNLAVMAEIQKAQTPADDHEQEAKAAVDEFLKQHPADGKERLKSIYAAVDSQNIKDDAAYNLAVMAEIQKAQTPAASGDNIAVDNLLNNPGNTEAVNEKMANDITEGSKVFGDPEKLGLRAAAARQGLRADRQHRLNENYYTDVFGSKLFHDAMDGNIVTPDSIRAAEYVRQLRAANAAKAQAAAEAAEQRADNPEGWL